MSHDIVTVSVVTVIHDITLFLSSKVRKEKKKDNKK